MHVLVTGASGYVGGRLVPTLLAAGHRVRVGVRRPASVADAPWADAVQVVPYDATDEQLTARAVRGTDAVVYLVHGLEHDDFAERDREAALTMAHASRRAGIDRIVYLSGLVPADDELSDHLGSRLEVEELLGSAGVPTLTLRAGIVIGAGSTSYELMRQLAQRLPVHAEPPLARSRVQPVAVTDLLTALTGALDAPARTRSYDVAGPDVLTYGELLATFARVTGLLRPRVPAPLAPAPLLGEVAALLTDVPGPTVRALVASMRHDMVAGEEDFRDVLLPPGHELLDVATAIRRAAARPDTSRPVAERDPLARLPQDPDWTAGSLLPLDALGTAAGVARGSLDLLRRGLPLPPS